MVIGLNQKPRDKKIIVSLTSYPARIKNVDKVIKSLLIQNLQPDRIILWLAKEEFPNLEADLPMELLELLPYGLEILWCSDLKSHKKYYQCMKEYPDNIIITVDDDVYYSPCLIEKLYASYRKYPFAISCMRANLICFTQENDFAPYSEWIKNIRAYGRPYMDLMPVGIGGVLYPPYSLDEDVFREDIIRKGCLYQDDIWLKFMALKKGVPTVLTENNCPLETIDGTQKAALCETINIDGNDKAIHNMTEYWLKHVGDSRKLMDTLYENKYSSFRSDEAEIQKKASELKQSILSFENYIIYGAGLGAQITYKALNQVIKERLPDYFAVTKAEKNEKELYGIPIIEINCLSNITERCIIIVSTSEKNQTEIKKTLQNLGFQNVLYVKDKVIGEIIRYSELKEKVTNEFLEQFINKSQLL